MHNAPELRRLKSSFSGDGGNNCVEVAATPAGAALRESDAPADILTTGQGPLLSLVRGLRTGAVSPRGPHE
ncbi:DUF397 domain-containing protein [Streptomyces poonensis]|uniref:DUF397 domain-containing protein n=1 Tax=Streptomyces poonensis TaxID=68255 RepID=A0A918P8B0_9ACTN|nr:DUF397 domain-containing protein [Streptomyces poonensis]GGY87452.1 hypothetical protein GCM10010365_01740 [Streptomyces poonensis]GLJ90214.1 hypothetical protein GCM10017589_28170 [Streptomyces poonensis]